MDFSKILQRLDGTVERLLADRVVEPRCRVARVELLRPLELRAGQGLALLLEVRLSKVAPADRIIGAERGGDLDVATSSARCPARILARPRPSRASGLSGSSDIARSNAVSRRTYRRGQRTKPSTVFARASSAGASAAARLAASLAPIEIAEREPQFGQPRQGPRIVGMIGDSLQQLVARRLQLQVCLQRVRQREPRGRGPRAALDGLAPAGERRRLIVLRHRDGRAKGIHVAVIRIQRQGLIEVGARSSRRPTPSRLRPSAHRSGRPAGRQASDRAVERIAGRIGW